MAVKTSAFEVRKSRKSGKVTARRCGRGKLGGMKGEVHRPPG